MKTPGFWTLAFIVTLGGLLQAQAPAKKGQTPSSDRENLIGAWHLVSIGESGADGQSNRQSNPGAEIKGMLIYTRDGHMSVQLMYPESAAALSNDYVLNGYEASFGSYDVDEAAHTVTHHVQGSITHGLIGKALTRGYQFTNGHLVIKSADPAEHWQVVWEHY